MITKAIVEQVIDKYTVRVRIPSLDRTMDSSVHTPTELLNVAIICTLPGCDPNVQPGDIVFISKEKSESELVILGYLYCSRMTSTFCDVTVNDLFVNQTATLSKDTQIGNVTSAEIQRLVGVKDSIQKQIDELKQQLEQLCAKLGGS